MKAQHVDHTPPVSILIGGCNGPYSEKQPAASGTKVRVLPLPPPGNEGGYDATDAAACERVGKTPLTVSQLVDILHADGGPDALFRQLPELHPQDVRDAVDYAARRGLLR